jgi:hypothetical protein
MHPCVGTGVACSGDGSNQSIDIFLAVMFGLLGHSWEAPDAHFGHMICDVLFLSFGTVSTII